MASSNRHWPSLFKSKPCNPHHQWQHDINSSSLISSVYQKTPYSSGPGCEERSPEPKPRWNPKPEQIRILEAIFNSGMVNPPRDEIRKIRAQLQEYGQVGDANVFYWFQNRKSRSKHKQRQLQSTKPPSRPAGNSSSSRIPVATSSSSSSSERSSSCSDKTLSSGAAAAGVATDAIDIAVSNVPTAASVNQTYLQQQQPHGEFSGEPFLFHGQLPAGYCFSAADFSSLVDGVPEPGLGLCSGMILSEIMSQEGFKSSGEEEAYKMKMQLHHGITSAATVPTATTATAATSVACPITEIQGIGIGGCGGSRSAVVFINEVAFEVGVGAVNVREAFGDDAVLLHSSGHPVLVDEWGVSIHPLQHGASYYLV